MIKKSFLITLFFVTTASCIFYSCTKDVGPNPLLDKESGFTDKALLDSCKNDAAFTFYKGSSSYYTSDPAAFSPHGNFKLKFNKIATAALGSDGKLPIGKSFPNGSMVVKETQSGLYAFLYKRNDSWLWGESNFDGTNIIKKVIDDATVSCIDCHKRPEARDLVLSFHFY